LNCETNYETSTVAFCFCNDPYQALFLGSNLSSSAPLQLASFFTKKAAPGKKILFILPWYVGGGMGTAFIALINNFPDSTTNIDLCILANKGPNLNFTALKRKNITYVTLSEAKEVKYDSVVCYAQWTSPSLWIDKINTKRRVQWIHSDAASASWTASFKKKMSSFNKVDAFVTVSDAAKQNFSKSFPKLAKKTYAVYNVIDNEHIVASSKEPQNEMIMNDDLLNVIFVGRLVSVKGIDMMIQVHSKLEKEGCHFRWYLVGYGPDKEYYETLAKKNGLEGKFIFLGYKENPYPYIKAADIFTLFSKTEGFGLVVTEAKILERPIIVTDFDAAFEQIESGKNGLIVENDLEAICTGMRKILHDQSLRAQFSKTLKGFRFDNKEGYREVQIALFGN
jgi:glycosyltransferase involved in cell wall biosynthesis